MTAQAAAGHTREHFADFARQIIEPAAARSDRDYAIPESHVTALAERGLLAPAVPSAFGGSELSATELGLLCAEIGAACTATRSLLTVQNMVAYAILRFGNLRQRTEVLPRLASGQAVAAFALTEPDTGSDAAAVQAELRPAPGGYVLRGVKRWITFGARADILLVLARAPQGLTAVLVTSRTPGMTRTPVRGQLGLRGAMLADVIFDNCPVDESDIVARPGLGFTYVANAALDHARYTVAWGCVGIAQACLRESLAYAARRHQFGRPIVDHQLIRRALTEMAVSLRAATLLCGDAGRLRDEGSPDAVHQTLIAKYHASTALRAVTADAVQIHGANGCAPGAVVERCYRDARVMEIIEGSTEMLQLLIPDYELRAAGVMPR